MFNIKQFDTRHLNDKCQNDMIVEYDMICLSRIKSRKSRNGGQGQVHCQLEV